MDFCKKLREKSVLGMRWCSRQTKVVVKYGCWTHQIGALSKGIRLATVGVLIGGI